MKTGRSLQSLAAEIGRRAATKRDLIVPTANLRMNGHGESKEIRLYVRGDDSYGITPHAHDQLAQYCKIPADYYKRMLANAPELLADNVNQWIDAEPKKRMIRTLDGRVRAMLSDGYRRIEHEDLAEIVLPIFADLNLDIMSCEITEHRLYLKAVDKNVSREMKALNPGAYFGDGGHTILYTKEAHPAITVANSETGEGRLSVLGGLYQGWCTNLATFSERSVTKTHLGARHELAADDALFELLSDETKRKTDEALWLQVRDTVRAIFDRTKFNALVDKVEGAQADPIDGNPIKVVNLAAKKFDLDKSQENSVLRHLIEGGSLSRFGLYNAMTRASQDVESYDEATRMEHLGGKVIELPQSEWRSLAMAA